MMEHLPYFLIIFIAVVGGIGTLLIGHSKANRVSNPEYDRRTKGNLGKLSWIYFAATSITLVAVAVYLSTQS